MTEPTSDPHPADPQSADGRADPSAGDGMTSRSMPGVPYLFDTGLVLPTALVTRAGPHTAFVRVFPLDATAQVAATARRAGFRLNRATPEADWLLLADVDGLADARLAALADALNAAGLRAFAYAGTGLPEPRAGERGRPRRLGTRRPEAADGTVFVEVRLHDPLFGNGPEAPPSAQTVVYGPSEDLELFQEAAAERFVIEPVPEIGGVAALWIDHAEVAAGLTSIEALVEELDAALRECGLQGPVHIVDRRDAPAGGGG
ncbi:hypothetical protein DRB06_02830 [Actinomyces sp. Z5]|uniref:hypothetical protein n=1 Tax=Actinomyces sp. Z5 TaxID=2250216 RepID=UPI000DCB5599|nr:hypothetical protein [Actinomyces sp. Z5]RAX23108.1 hypothetical protein DRB06_02830 [Actinomyces sp. Z5]